VRRRDVVRLGATAALLPMAAPRMAAALTKDELKQQERVYVAKAVAAEQTAMVAFVAIANGGVLDDRTTGTMRVLSAHATKHSELMAESFKTELGEDPPLPPTRTAIAGLAGLRRQVDALRLAMQLLDRAIAAHLVAVGYTHDAQLLKAISGIVASDGQSLVLLRQLLKEQPVPSAFERGGS
jgi:hypothetical protein